MDIFTRMAELSECGGPFMLATVVSSKGSSPAKPGFRMIVESSGSSTGTIGGGAVEKLIIDEASAILSKSVIMPKPENRKLDLNSIGMECGGGIELFIEYFGGRKSFVLFGGGHVGQALAPILELLGYNLTIFDNRPVIEAFIASEKRNLIISDYNDISAVNEILRASGGCFIASHGQLKIVMDRVVFKNRGLLKFSTDTSCGYCRLVKL
jgi:xanthine dehydrogenase accessory factor